MEKILWTVNSKKRNRVFENLMTVRIAKMLGLDEILNLSKKLNIYEEIPELLSVSLGTQKLH